MLSKQLPPLSRGLQASLKALTHRFSCLPRPIPTPLSIHFHRASSLSSLEVELDLQDLLFLFPIKKIIMPF